MRGQRSFRPIRMPRVCPALLRHPSGAVHRRWGLEPGEVVIAEPSGEGSGGRTPGGDLGYREVRLPRPERRTSGANDVSRALFPVGFRQCQHPIEAIGQAIGESSLIVQGRRDQLGSELQQGLACVGLGPSHQDEGLAVAASDLHRCTFGSFEYRRGLTGQLR